MLATSTSLPLLVSVSATLTYHPRNLSSSWIHTFVVHSFRWSQRCYGGAVACSNCLSMCLCVLTDAFLDPYYCCNFNLAASTVFPSVAQGNKVCRWEGLWVGERQMTDRQGRAIGEKMGASLLIVHLLMIKKAFPSPCAEQQIVVVSVSFTWGCSEPSDCLSLLLRPAAQTRRLTSFWWLLALACPAVNFTPFNSPLLAQQCLTDFRDYLNGEKKAKCTHPLGYVSFYPQPHSFKCIASAASKNAGKSKKREMETKVPFFFFLAHSLFFAGFSMKSKCLL